MRLKNINYIYEKNPKEFKMNEKLFEELSKVIDIKLFEITDNVKKWTTEEQLEKCYIIDIREISKNILGRKKYGSWFALDKDYFIS